MRVTARLVFGVVMACLFFSGMAGLVYEIVWARYLGLFLGHTSYAVVAVLVAFMGGLALGNAWIGRWADTCRRPLAFYAWIEIGVGLFAVVFSMFYGFSHSVFIALARHFEPGGGTLAGLKFVFSLAMLLAPTVLMGGSLPLLARLLTKSLSELRASVAALYFVNSAGAVAGCLVGDFWFIPSWGLQSSLYAAAAMNLAAGAAALFTSGWMREGRSAAGTETGLAPQANERASDAGQTESRPAAQEGEVFTQNDVRLAVLGIGLSGFVAMLYEVAWTRLLALVLGSSTHAFSIMLVTFIAGIAAGAWVIYKWRGLRRTFDAFGWAELALAATLLLSMFFYGDLPFWFARMGSFLVRRPDTYSLYELLQGLFCFAVMFVPASCLGMTLPLVSRIATRELPRTGSSVGAVFAINTLGTVLGAAATGFWLMPALGLPRTFALGIGLNALIGVAVLGRRLLTARPALLFLLPVATGLWIWLAGMVFDPAWQGAFSIGLFRQKNPPSTLKEYRANVKNTKTVYYRDGAGATVAVLPYHDYERDLDHLFLKVNGKTDASTTDDMSTQIMSAHLPLLMHPAPQDVLVVGLGSGVTCGSVLCHPGVKRLDAVEISPEVVDGARLFGPYNHQVLKNPRMRLFVEDAKTFLQVSPATYDVIISEPSNPWMAGVAGVFSREFYSTCRSRLKPGGIMLQWVQVYETNDDALDIMLATFGSVFPDFAVWQGSLGDILLVGGRQVRDPNPLAIKQRLEQPEVKADLARINITGLPILLGHEVVSRQRAPYIASFDTQVHSDFYPVLEYVAQEAFFVRQDTERWMRLDESYSPRATTGLARYLAANPLTAEDYEGFEKFHFTPRFVRAPLVRSLLQRWRRDEPENIKPVVLMARISDVSTAAQLESLRLAPLRNVFMEHAATDPQLLRHYALSTMDAYREQRSVFHTPNTTNLTAGFERLIATDAKNQRIYRLCLAELAYDRGDDEECLRLGQAALNPETSEAGPMNFSLDPMAPRRAVARIIDGLVRAGRLLEARAWCDTASKNGYVTQTGNSPDLQLGLIYRKVALATALRGSADPASSNPAEP